jgi:hypothetical protein
MIIVSAQEDLYQQPTNSVQNSTSPTQFTPSDNYSGDLNLSSGGAMETVITSPLGETIFFINIFTIALCILLSFILISNFFYLYKFYSDNNFDREKQGSESLWQAVYVWMRYIPIAFLSLFSLLAPNTLVRIIIEITIILGFCVKYYFDLLIYLNITNYFSWYNDLAANIKKLLKFYEFKKSKK